MRYFENPPAVFITSTDMQSRDYLVGESLYRHALYAKYLAEIVVGSRGGESKGAGIALAKVNGETRNGEKR